MNGDSEPSFYNEWRFLHKELLKELSKIALQNNGDRQFENDNKQ